MRRGDRPNRLAKLRASAHRSSVKAGTRTWAAALGAALVLGSLPALAAPPTPAQRCQAAKLLAAGGEARAQLVCLNGDQGAPGAFAQCIAHAAERRDAAFTRAEARGGCATTGDSAALGAIVDDLTLALRSELRPMPTSARCTVAQLGAAGRAISRLAQAYARDKRFSDAARLAANLTAAQQQFESAFARAIAKNDCLSASTAAETWAVVAQGGARIRGNLCPMCGDGVQGPGESCDGGDTGSCVGTCLPNCTCASGDGCGDGVVQTGEECDGSGCIPEDPNGCFPPGSSSECQCCAQEEACYIRGFGTVVPVEIPCCTGACNIPGPEAGPNVMVFCTEPPATPCPCWTSTSLDAAFPPGFFDHNGRGGAVCNSSGTIAAVWAVDTCRLYGPGGMEYVFPRGGAGVGFLVEDNCVLFPDLDPGNTGTCNGIPTVFDTTVEQSAACVAALQASQVYQAECP